MNKAILLFMLMMLLSVSAIAEDMQKVMVVKFHHENQMITFVEKTVKDGNYPDRKIQPLNGHRITLLSGQKEILYNMKFDIPDTVFVDVEQNGTLSGGAIKLDATDFALVLPYFNNVESIKIYDNNETEVLNVNVAPQLSKKREMFLPVVLGGLFLILVIAIILVLFHHRRNPDGKYGQ